MFKVGISRWLASLVVGLAFLLGAAPLPALAQASDNADINNGLCAGANLNFGSTCQAGGVGNDQAVTKINNIIHLIINTLSAVVGVVAVIMIVVGGFRYITSGGADTSVSSAKNTILYAIIGLVIVALAQFIVRFVLGKITVS